MAATMRVELVPVTNADSRQVLANLYPLYLDELSAFTDYYTLDDLGRWVPDHLDDWLHARLPGQHPLLLYAGRQLAGFALVGTEPFTFRRHGRRTQMAEFFVLRYLRRTGVGRAAAGAAFDRFPGTWEVTEVPANIAAVTFWRRVIGDYTSGDYAEVVDDLEVAQLFTTAS
ncbi:MAG: GNAT family N-acetyltransferase [Actinomycetota bacterium]|jgi:predicted acetyltransferase|nr:GNAT family N-acetyltransferase [Actinomycetota bacterium]